MFSLWKKSKNSLFHKHSNSHQAVLPKTTSYNFLQISTPFLFMDFSLDKNEKFYNLLETFIQGHEELSFKIKSLQSVYNLLQILTNSVFPCFLFYWNPNTVCLTVHWNSHQAVLPKTTSSNSLQIFTPFLFMGSNLEKNEKFYNSLEPFFKSYEKILYNLITILIKF